MESPFINLCLMRRSVRRFSAKPVEKEKILRCLEAARLAPSADNGQPWRFVVFDDPEKKQALTQAVFKGVFAASSHFARAPVLIALLLKESLIINRLSGGAAGVPFQYIDSGIAGEHFVLAATEQGLGTCWVGWFDSRALLKHLGLGRGYRAVALIALGYHEGDLKPRTPKRKPLEEIAFWNSAPK